MFSHEVDQRLLFITHIFSDYHTKISDRSDQRFCYSHSKCAFFTPLAGAARVTGGPGEITIPLMLPCIRVNNICYFISHSDNYDYAN